MAHKYSTLLHDDSIRLLKLLPTSDIPTDHGLNCGLEDYRLSDDPIYEALSYTWGNPIFPEILNTHSGILRITENLASALRGVRFRGRVRYLWVDAVCINQDDKREKGRQVALMGPIYKSARQVICWLGQEDEDVGDAIENLKRLTAFASRSGLDEPFHSVKRAEFLDNKKVQEEAFKELAPAIDFSALTKIYSNPYFTRQWIIQEIALARDAVLIVKSSSITYDEFAMATAVLHIFLKTFTNDTASLTFSAIRSAWHVVSTKLAYTQKKKRDVLTHVQLAVFDYFFPRMNKLLDTMGSSSSQCSDPRDRIYGLLSLSNEDTNDIDLTVDYAKSTSEVYTDFAKAYLVLNEIRVLNHAGLQRIGQTRAEMSSSEAHTSTAPLNAIMPSWVSDWRVPRPYMDPGGSRYPYFKAGFSLPTQVEIDPTETNKLLISGFQIDSVAQVRRPVNHHAAHADLPPSYATHERPRASILALQGFCELHYQNSGITEYMTGEDILTVFVRTVLADGVHSSFRLLFPIFDGLPEGMVLLWRLFALLKLKPDNTINLPQHITLPNMQTAEPATSRAQSVKTAWVVLTFMVWALRNRAIIITSQGYLGVGPALTEVGDSVILFGGFETPFVMRKASKIDNDAAEKDFCILGECYLHGFMNGELLTEEHRARMKTFSVV